MSTPSIDDIRKEYKLPAADADRIAARRQSAMVKGLKHAQNGYVKTVVDAAEKARTTSVKTAQETMTDEVGPESMLAGPAETGGPDHALSRTLHEIAFYPQHNARKESAEYAKVHHQLVVEQDLPCLSCGVKQSTLKDPKQNLYGAKAIETHHHVVEWALANALDVNKFNAKILPALAHRHSADPQYKQPFTEQQMLAWVDHSADNLWVLCDVHHRHVYLGIHAITDPIWGPVDIVRDEFLTKGFMQLAKGVIPNIKGAQGPTSRTGGAAKKTAKKTAPQRKAKKQRSAAKKPRSKAKKGSRKTPRRST